MTWAENQARVATVKVCEQIHQAIQIAVPEIQSLTNSLMLAVTGLHLGLHWALDAGWMALKTEPRVLQRIAGRHCVVYYQCPLSVLGFPSLFADDDTVGAEVLVQMRNC